MNLSMLNLTKQYNNIKAEIDTVIHQVLSSGAYINGPQVKEFEDNMAAYLGVKHAIGVASGSDALLLSLDVLDIAAGDKVIVPTFTFFATAGAVSRLGAIPVFVDIDPITYNIDLNQVEDLLKKDPQIKAIIPVHLFGLPMDMQRLMNLAEEYNIKVIEDACQAINADIYTRSTSSFSRLASSDNSVSRLTSNVSRSQDACQAINADIYINKKVRSSQEESGKSQVLIKKAGALGNTGCFSFFPSKNLGCFGDGGMVVTNDDELAEKIKILRVHGSSPKYYHSIVGYNSRLDTIQAAILNIKLKYLNEWTEKRRQVAQKYNNEFQAAGLAKQEGTVPDVVVADDNNIHGKNNSAMIHGDCPRRSILIPELTNGHVFHQYVIQVDQRDQLAAYLKEKGINTAIYYPVPLHLQQCFSNLGYHKGDLSQAENVCQKVLALPIDPELTEPQVQYIVNTIKQFIQKTFSV